MFRQLPVIHILVPLPTRSHLLAINVQGLLTFAYILVTLSGSRFIPQKYDEKLIHAAILVECGTDSVVTYDNVLAGSSTGSSSKNYEVVVIFSCIVINLL